MSSFEIIQKEVSLVFDSGQDGIQNLDPLRAPNSNDSSSVFSVQFDEPIEIPKNAIAPVLSVEEAIIYNNNPNLVNGGVVTIADVGGANPQIINIPPGNWATDELQEQIALASGLETVDIGGGSKRDQIEIVGVNALNKVQIINNSGKGGVPLKEVTFSSEFYDVLGFDATQFPIAGVANKQIVKLGTKTAQVQALNYYLVATDLIADGIRFNNDYNQIVAQVPIDANTGSAILYRPMIPAKIPVDELKGIVRSTVQVRLLKNDLTLANTFGDDWSVRFSIKWKELLHLDVHKPNPTRRVN